MYLAMISLGFMMPAGIRSSSSKTHFRCTHDYSQVNWDEFVHYQVGCEVYAEAGS